MARHYVSPRTRETDEAAEDLAMPPLSLATAPQSSARGALYLPDAPGAFLDGKFSGWGDYARATRFDYDRVRAAMQERVPSQGGFLVPELLRSDMMLATIEKAIIRPLATVIPVSTLRTGIPFVDDTSHASTVLGGWNFAWTEESAALATSTPTYGRIVYEAKKLTAYTSGVPDELVGDAAALQAFLRGTVPMALAWAEDNAFIQGSGTGQPQGVLNAPCAVNVSRQTASKVGMTDILSMLTRILPQSMSDCIWLCSPDVLQQILQAFFAAEPTVVNVPVGASTVATSNPNPFPVQVQVSGGTVTAIAINGTATNATSGTFTLGVGGFISTTNTGAPTYTTTALSSAVGVVPPPSWLMGSPSDGWTLLGRPLIATEHCPALGTRGDLMLVDPRFYVIADRVTMQLASSARGAKFAQDQTEFRFISRVDGRIWLQSAVTPENSSSTVSAVVILN